MPPAKDPRDKRPSVQPPGLTVRSLDDAEAALRELGELARIEAGHKAACDKATAAAKQEFAGKMITVVCGEKITIATRVAFLEQALEAWFLAHRDELCEAGKKSIDLNHGTLGTRWGQPSIKPAPGEPVAGRASVLDSIAAALLAALKKFKLFSGCQTHRFFKVGVTIDNASLLKAYQAQELTDEDLATIGKVFQPPAETFYVKPAEHVLQSHPAG